jgi:hypothetical protein
MLEPRHTSVAPVIETASPKRMETFELLGQGPAVVYVTVYVEGDDAETLITPVDAFILNPPVELNVPPPHPVIVGVGSTASTQYAAAP